MDYAVTTPYSWLMQTTIPNPTNGMCEHCSPATTYCSSCGYRRHHDAIEDHQAEIIRTFFARQVLRLPLI